MKKTFRFKFIKDNEDKRIIWFKFLHLKDCKRYFLFLSNDPPCKDGAMETPHHGNASPRKCFKKKAETPQKPGFFWGVSAISVKKTEIPQNPVFEGFPLFFEAIPKIFRPVGFLDDKYVWGISQYFWGISQYFWGVSAKYLSRFRIFKNSISLRVFAFFWGLSAKYVRRFRIFKNSI